MADKKDKLEEVKDWQENQYDIGRYYDPNQNPNLFNFLKRMPILLVVAGIVALLLAVVIGVSSGFIANIHFVILLSLIGIIFIIGGKQRIERNNNN